MDSNFKQGFLKEAFGINYLKGLNPKHQKKYVDLISKAINLKGSDNAMRRNILQNKIQAKDKNRIVSEMKLEGREKQKFLETWEKMVKEKMIK